MSGEEKTFDDMGGEFEARLRRTTMQTRTSRNEGREITVSSPVAIIEAKFSYKVLDRLYFPSFVAIERAMEGVAKHVIYEVVGVSPMHYQLSGVDSSMPTLLRKEYLDTIKESWGRSQETWIDMTAVPTSYVLSLAEGSAEFKRAPYVPLPGAQARLLSKDAVQKFLCEEQGVRIGTMPGFDLPFTVSMENLVRYHAGFFAFTGSGKSNLTSSLVRKAMQNDPDLTVVVLDIAGEYAVNLLDLLAKDAKVYTTEQIDTQSEFCSSQAIPESLEETSGREKIEAALAKVYGRGVERISNQTGGGVDLAWIQGVLQSTIDNSRTGGTAALVALGAFTAEFLEKRRLRLGTDITELDEDAKSQLTSLLQGLYEKVNEKSGLHSDLEIILEVLRGGQAGAAGEDRFTPERLAEQLARGTAPRLNVLYLPDPLDARSVASRLIRRLILQKKRLGNRERVLIVLDEAQEYIPDNPSEKLHTMESNYAVELLLRQGRKYRVHCWLATQRVAHLNVNALQQLHSYFVSTLPRFYDRMVIADAFGLPYEVLERSADLATGEWLFVSFKAAKQRNVPVFLRTDNNESVVVQSLGG